jgi:hypothetical protein
MTKNIEIVIASHRVARMRADGKLRKQSIDRSTDLVSGLLRRFASRNDE